MHHGIATVHPFLLILLTFQPEKAVKSLIVTQYHGDQHGNILDVDATQAVNIGVLLNERFGAVAKHLRNQSGNVLDVNNVVAVHITDLAFLGLLKYLNINDVRGVFHAVNRVMCLDTDAPGEEGIVTLSIGAVEVNTTGAEVIISYTIRNLGQVNTINKDLFIVSSIGSSVEGEELVIVQSTSVEGMVKPKRL